MLSSSMTFQVVADEIREGQAAYQKKWEKETRGMREHLSINQKRLFLLEQEKNQLQQTASTSESLTGVLRDRVSGLATENAALSPTSMSMPVSKLTSYMASTWLGL